MALRCANSVGECPDGLGDANRRICSSVWIRADEGKFHLTSNSLDNVKARWESDDPEVFRAKEALKNLLDAYMARRRKELGG